MSFSDAYMRPRPQYESPIDRRKEQLCAKAFLTDYNLRSGYPCSLVKLPYSDRIDYQLSHQGQCAGYLECKARSARWEHSDTWFVSAAKVESGFQLAERDNVLFHLVMAWGQNVYTAIVTRWDVVKIEEGGNLQRNDGKGDIEPMAHFHRKIFRWFALLPELAPAPHKS